MVQGATKFEILKKKIALSKTIAEGALQVTDNETTYFQDMLFKGNCSISISCAMWGSVACRHKAIQGLHQLASSSSPPIVPRQRHFHHLAKHGL